MRLSCLALLVLCLFASPAKAESIRCAVPFITELTGRPAKSLIAPAGKPAKAPAAAAREFWAWDLTVMPPGFRRVPTTLRGEGSRCLVYVEDAEWGRTVDQAAIDTIVRTFETRTPRHPARGIADVDTEAFGEIPLGQDGEPRVIILFVKLGRWQGQGFDGFFNAFDTLTEEAAWTQYGQHSNEAEVLYLNTDGNPPASDYMLSVLSHELVHLLAHPHDPEEAGWVGESLGEAGMLLCGYDTDQAHARRYASKPATPLVTEPYVSYGACLMLAGCLIDQQPAGFLRRLVTEPARGIEGIEKTLDSFGANDGFAGLFEQFVAGNLVSGLGSTSPDWAYRSVHVPAMSMMTVPAAGLPATSGKMQATGVAYLKFEAAGAYSVSVETSGPAPLKALSIARPASSAPVVTPLAGSEFTLQAEAGDCVALYGLEKGLYGYRVSVEKMYLSPR